MVGKELMEKTGISTSTVAKMTKGEPVNMQILWKICTELDSDIGELVCIDKSIEEDKKWRLQLMLMRESGVKKF